MKSKKTHVYSFWFHYNKIASRQQKRNILTFHWKGICYPVNKITCKVPIISRDRKQQPYCVMAGKAHKVSFLLGDKEVVAKIE